MGGAGVNVNNYFHFRTSPCSGHLAAVEKDVGNKAITSFLPQKSSLRR